MDPLASEIACNLELTLVEATGTRGESGLGDHGNDRQDDSAKHIDAIVPARGDCRDAN